MALVMMALVKDQQAIHLNHYDSLKAKGVKSDGAAAFPVGNDKYRAP